MIKLIKNSEINKTTRYRFYGIRCNVVFENGSFRAEFKGDFEEYSFDLIDVVAQSCEVIGNIHENSKLMEDN